MKGEGGVVVDGHGHGEAGCVESAENAGGGAGAGGGAAAFGDEYRLRALVMHHGGQCWSGHYTAMARLGDGDTWASYDDRCVSVLDHDPTLQPMVQRSGYLLLYEKVEPATAMAMGAASAEREGRGIVVD